MECVGGGGRLRLGGKSIVCNTLPPSARGGRETKSEKKSKEKGTDISVVMMMMMRMGTRKKQPNVMRRNHQ